MDDPYWIAFKHENGFFIGGEGIDGNGRAVNNWNSGYSKSYTTRSGTFY
jgi:hypothetical protein